MSCNRGGPQIGNCLPCTLAPPKRIELGSPGQDHCAPKTSKGPRCGCKVQMSESPDRRANGFRHMIKMPNSWLKTLHEVGTERPSPFPRPPGST